MTNNIFDKFDEQFKNDYSQQIKDVEENGVEIKEVPVGTYAVVLEKAELKSTKDGKPMASIQFRIIDGEYKKYCLFYNQVLTNEYGFSALNQFINSMNVGIDAKYTAIRTYNYYGNLLLDLAEKCDKKVSFDLELKKNNKGYNVFKIKDTFDM